MRRHRRRALRRRYGHSAETRSARLQQFIDETNEARAEVRQAMIAEQSGVRRTARVRSQAEVRRAREKKEHTQAVRRIARLGGIKRHALSREKTLRAQQRAAEVREEACAKRETKRIVALAKKAATARSKAEEADREIVELVRRYPTVSKLATTLHV